eukprot:TRINITY_DN65_c0_g1_i3.p1 TRINITY_DN65_c0_g1~~TRINITY_DN65_c0_g1_i3.p1  ORF type:complete len:290 (-),score=34.63 TRINITY_DN65_c0_g1_i3:459-1328(-)
MKAFSVVVLFLFFTVALSLKWGPYGHKLTGAVAQQFLTSNAVKMIQNLSPESDGKLVNIVTWADSVKKQEYPWSECLHYVNTVDWSCEYIRSRDCKSEEGVKDFCVDMAIQNYTKQVLDTSLPSKQRDEAVKFVAHFIGDSHQPLHCGFTSDRGGNSIKGTFLGEQTNLHFLWDGIMLEKRAKEGYGDNFDRYVNDFVTRIKTGEWSGVSKSWTQCSSPVQYGLCSDEWVQEAAKLACEYSYVDVDGHTHVPNNFKLGLPYYNRTLPPSELQIARSAMRMASVFNNLFH